MVEQLVSKYFLSEKRRFNSHLSRTHRYLKEKRSDRRPLIVSAIHNDNEALVAILQPERVFVVFPSTPSIHS